MELAEIKSEREVFGNDGRAINKHSIRIYEDAQTGEFFEINKTLDGVPPFYELFSRSDLRRKTVNKHTWLESISSQLSPIFPERIKADKQEYWGDGITWLQAEIIAQKAIEQWYLSN